MTPMLPVWYDMDRNLWPRPEDSEPPNDECDEGWSDGEWIHPLDCDGLEGYKAAQCCEVCRDDQMANADYLVDAHREREMEDAS